MALKDKIAEAFGVPAPAEGEAPRDESGRLKLRTAMEAKGGPLGSAVNELGQAFGNMGIRAGANYLSMATGNPGYAASSEDIINGLDNYANEVHYQSFLNREGKWIQQEIEDISTESRNMMKPYSVRIDQNGNALAPDQPVPDGMQVGEKSVLYNPESGKPFDPLDKSTWTEMHDGQNIINRANQTYHRKMMGLLQQVQQVGMTWYPSNPHVANLVGNMTGSYIQGLSDMFAGEQQGAADQRAAEQARYDQEAPLRAAEGFAGAQGAPAGPGAPAGGPLRGAPTGPPGGTPPGTATPPAGAQAGPIRGPSPADQAGAAVQQAATQTPGTQEFDASITDLPSAPTEDEILQAAEIFKGGRRASPEAMQWAKGVAGRRRATEVRGNQVEGVARRIYERNLQNAFGIDNGAVGIAQLMQEDIANANTPGYIPRAAGIAELAPMLQAEAQGLAEIHVRRQEVAQRLAQVNPEFADLGPEAKEEYLNDWLKDREAMGDTNAGELVYTGSLKDEFEALGLKYKNKMDSAIAERTTEAQEQVATLISQDPEAFAAELKQHGGETQVYDYPLQDLASNPAMVPDANGRLGFGSKWFQEGHTQINEFPVGTPERAAAKAWFIRQTDRNLQGSAEARQTEIDGLVGHPESGEYGPENSPHQLSEIGKLQAGSDVTELLLDQNLASELKDAAPEHVGIKMIADTIDRWWGEETGTIEQVTQELLTSEQGYQALQVAYEKKHGQPLQVPRQELYDMIVGNGYSGRALDEHREQLEGRVGQLETQKNELLEFRNDVLTVWSNVSDLEAVPDYRAALNPPQAQQPQGQ